MTNIEKFKVDYSPTTHFPGIRIFYEYLSEGLEYAEKNAIADICVWSGTDTERQTVNFDFLQGKEFIKTFHWIVPLTKQSKIEGIYSLTHLKNFRWDADNDFEIDFSKLSSLEKLNITHSFKLLNMDTLTSLKELYIQSVKTEDCSFVSSFTALEKLRIINGHFDRLDGLENCQNLTSLSLVKCSNITEITSTVSKLKKLESLVLDKCKNLSFDKNSLSVNHISVIK
jgi:hypothetical protein